MQVRFQRQLLGGLLIGLAISLSGCSQGEWSAVWVGLTAPAPAAYQYYYAPAYRAYYCYYPNAGWQYFPGQPPQGAVFYSGSIGYLPPPGPPPAQVQFYYDRRDDAYYYHGPQNHWHYLPGRPPQGAPQWHGRAPNRRYLPPSPPGWHYRGHKGRGPGDGQRQVSHGDRQQSNNQYQYHGGGKGGY